ncbi:predicted protein [Nematostella vectensis]|uniref:UbiA prenyltransferase domain-containing protein 1 homolog n=1 Tax=Nematostella vectensis TaxID=45351 RepID=A7SJ00_NEMVE|nr:predicted protein [Nematostella vectensis]|eukprot:XP_001628397.1 predicted protein [Nematostella vectensis]
MSSQKRYLTRHDIRLNSLKPWTLPSSIFPLLLGTVLAWKHDQSFDLQVFVLSAIVVAGTHAAGNFVNSYYEATTRKYYSSISERRFTINDSARCAFYSYCLVIPIFAYLVVVSRASIWHEAPLFIIGLLASMMFGNGLKNVVPGEFLVSGVYGPLCVFFSYLVQVGGSRQLSAWWIAVYALPLSINTEIYLHSQNIRDIKIDQEQGAHTLAVLLGNRFSLAVLPLFLLLPYMVTCALAMLKSQFFFLPLLSSPLAMLALPSDVHDKVAVALLPRRVSIVGLAFGILYLQCVLYCRV